MNLLIIIVFQIFKFFHIDPSEKNRSERNGNQFRERKGIPNCVEPCHTGKYISQGQNAQKLSGYRYDKAVDAVAQRLEDGAEDDTVACEQEAGTDDAEGGNAYLQHVIGRIEQLQQAFREYLENYEANQHDADGNKGAKLDGIHDSLFMSGAVIIGDNRNHAVVQAEDGHKDKALELEINTQDGDGRLGKHYQDFIHSECHDGYDGLHDNRRNTDFIYFRYNTAVRFEPFK